jgi:hypothetical protein
VSETSQTTANDVADEPAAAPVEPHDAEKTEDRLFNVVAFGLMLLLLICVALILIADRRPPAGL